ncbi:MAG: 16S rRNA (guanine(527)-N(7))-methyltransferase RsmG [Candidatus Dormibacteria bacterium]
MEPGGALQVRLERFLDLLYAANRSLNLTRVPREDAGARHLEESLSLLELAAWEDGAEALDLGTGGGLPGIPLALARPGVRFRLLERTQKKAHFLAAAVEELRLDNVEVVAQDSREHRSSPGFRPPDYLVSRAALPLARLVPEVGRLLGPRGTALLLVSPGSVDAALEPLALRAGLAGFSVLRPGPATVLRLRRGAAPPARTPGRPAGAPSRRPPRGPLPRG